MRSVLRGALTALCCVCCSGDPQKGLYEPCGEAAECDQEMPGNGVMCDPGPFGAQPFCTVSCGKVIEEAKGASPAKVGDCIQGVHDGSFYLCNSGCCHIRSSTQESADDDMYAVSGVCLPTAP